MTIASGCDRPQEKIPQPLKKEKTDASIPARDKIESEESPNYDPSAKTETIPVKPVEPSVSDRTSTFLSSKSVEFLFEDSFCKEILESPTLENFKRSHPQVRIDHSRSDSKLGLEVYRDGEFFSYSFVDGILLQSTFTLLRSQESSSKTIQKYENGLGKPTSTWRAPHFLIHVL